MAELKAELDVRFARFEATMNLRFAQQDARITLLTWMVGFSLTPEAGILVAVFFHH